jgi:uncharacterized membrane protein
VLRRFFQANRSKQRGSLALFSVEIKKDTSSIVSSPNKRSKDTGPKASSKNGNFRDFSHKQLLASSPLKSEIGLMSSLVRSITREKLAPLSPRLLPVDGLRGLIILVMALDHANHFIAQKHSTGEYWGGPFPIYDDVLPFATRLVTHLAAPGFFFLMGVGMFYFAQSREENGWSRWSIVRHFWIRGAILIVIQFLIVNRAWELSPNGWGLEFYVGVLFALGGTMIIGSFLLWLRTRYLVMAIMILVIGTELLHPDPASWAAKQTSIADLFMLRPGGDVQLWSNYPILPWLELVVFGLLFGHWLRSNPGRAYRRGLILGLLFLLVFLVLRWLDGFGNIRPRAGNSWIDFLNVVKYPPSLTFTLLTTGINLVILWLFSKIANTYRLILEPLAVFGRAPLFFYILHLFFYAGLGYLLVPNGTTILMMYPYWLLGVILLFPFCFGFVMFKKSRSEGSLVRYF